MKVRGVEIDLRPLQPDKLARTQTVAIADQDHCRIAVTVRGLDVRRYLLG
jgi:hypothetical protein